MTKRLCAIHRIVTTAAVVGMASATISTPVAAQIAPTRVDSVRHRNPGATKSRSVSPQFTIAPYGWMLGVHGETQVRDLSANVDVSFQKILDHLRFAAMGAFEVGYGPWLGTVDGLYASLRDTRTLALDRAQPDLDMTLKISIDQAFAGYSFVPAPGVAIDLLAGTRIWALDASLTVSGNLANVTRSRSPSWADALGGFRVRVTPADRWHVSLTGDGGGGGSRGTGEGIATVGYDLSHHWNLFGAYRYLYEDYRKNDYVLNAHLNGPAIGGAYRW
jgi:hypothetical protein